MGWRKGSCSTCANARRNAGLGATSLSPVSLLCSCSFHASLYGCAQLDLFSHSKHTQLYQYGSKPFCILDDREVPILRTGPLVDPITGSRFAKWSDDRTQLNKLLSLYHTSLGTIPLWPRQRARLFNLLTTTPRSVAASPLHPST